MDSKERSSPKHWRVEDILGHLNDNVDKNNFINIIKLIKLFLFLIPFIAFSTKKVIQ
jgi:hypothetical protein